MYCKKHNRRVFSSVKNIKTLIMYCSFIHLDATKIQYNITAFTFYFVNVLTINLLTIAIVVGQKLYVLAYKVKIDCKNNDF